MRRNSKGYRLQLIKETAERQQRRMSSDPMVNHIEELLSTPAVTDNDLNFNHNFAGHHYDDNIGGWVSDRWH